MTVCFFFVNRTQNFETTSNRWLFKSSTGTKLAHCTSSFKFLLVTLKSAINRFVIFNVYNKHAYKNIMFFVLVSEIGLQRKDISNRKSRNKSLILGYFCIN